MFIVALFSSDITAAAAKSNNVNHAEMIKKIAEGITVKKASFVSWKQHKKDKVPNINYFEAVIIHDGKEVTIQYFPKDDDEGVTGYVSICVESSPGLSFTTDLNGMVLGTPKDTYFEFLEEIFGRFK